MTAVNIVPLVASVASVAQRASVAWPAPLDEAAYHGLAGRITRTIEPHTEADSVAILIQMLAAFGNVIGRNPYFPIERDRHHTNIYAVLVGETSKARKGTSLGWVLRLFERVDADWATDRNQSGLSSGEGLIWAVRNPIVGTEPVRQNGKVTEYQEVMTDAGVADKRLFVVEPEFAKVLRVMRRDGNTLSPVVREAWDTGNLSSLTKNSPARATDAHITIIGHITTQEFQRHLDDTEAANGFMNRFLVVCVRRSKMLPLGGSLSDEALDPLIAEMREVVTFAQHIEEVRFDEAAQEMWCDIYPDLSAGRPGLVGSMTSRAEAQVIRLATIYALLDQSALISEEHLRAALELWRYAKESMAMVFGDRIGDPFVEDLLDAIRSYQDGMSRTDIRDHFKRHAKQRRIEDALTMLQELRLIECRKQETGGRHTEIWFATEATNATEDAGPQGEGPDDQRPPSPTQLPVGSTPPLSGTAAGGDRL